MIKPLAKRIIARPLLDKESGLIEIPDQFKQQGTVSVLAIGNRVKLDLKVGDRVLLHPNAAWTNFEFEGETLRAINEEFLLAVMEG